MTDDGIFDGSVAATYDAQHGTASDQIDAVVACLADLAAGGPALEFAIGTGRIALPLARRGVAVSGIELSQAMVDVLRAKPGGQDIPVTVGDMTCARQGRDFALVYLVYNTIDNLTSQEAQIRCFQNAAAHLRPGGCFVVETLVPPLQRLPQGETLLAFSRSATHWGMDEIDVVSQCYWSHHTHFDARGQANRLAVPFRYVWPAELDLMARIADMKLQDRWAGWDKSTFAATSRAHVSVWRKAE